MTEPIFFKAKGALTVGEIAALAGAALPEGAEAGRAITGIAPLDRAGPSDLTFCDKGRYTHLLRTTQAGLCLIGRKFASEAPAGLLALVARDPYRTFVTVARRLFPDAMRPSSLFGSPPLLTIALTC